MDIQSTLNPMTLAQGGTGSGDENAPGKGSLVGHVVTAAALGSGIASVSIWCLQLAHLNPPDTVVAGVGAICTVLASAIMQRIGE